MSLTKERLEQLGFNYHEGSVFENDERSYYARETVLLFFTDNPPFPTACQIGYGFSTFDGKYYAAKFKWVTKEDQLREVYKAITNEDL